MFLLGAGLTYGWGVAVDKAWGATAAPSPVEARCDSDRSWPCSSYHNARQFRAGEIRRRDGYARRLDDIYKNPRAARRVWVRKIARTLRRHDAARGVSSRVLLATDYPALARREYRRNVRNASCLGVGNYPAWSAGPRACTRPPNFQPWDKEVIQNVGAAVICGGGIAIAVGATPATGGVALAAAWGAFGCMWGLWAAMD